LQMQHGTLIKRFAELKTFCEPVEAITSGFYASTNTCHLF